MSKKLTILLILIVTASLSAQDTIKIGLLIQEKSEQAAVRGAELAVNMANMTDQNGPHFRIIIKSMEGPWGTGSKQAVSLIWDDNVCALVGSHDGRNAHLVEQASAKSIVPFISAWSSDPTLSQAFIPWFFNVVPNDDQQAVALIEEIFDKNNFNKVLVISDNTYDSNQAFKSFLKYAGIKRKSKPATLNYDDYYRFPEKLAVKINTSAAECIILFTRPEASVQIVRLLKENDLSQPVYGSLLILNENKLSDNEFQELKNFVTVPLGSWSESKFNEFWKSYSAVYESKPGLVAAFAYDGINALIAAIRMAKSQDNEKIKQALYDLNLKGVTGNLDFGDLGVRLNACSFK